MATYTCAFSLPSEQADGATLGGSGFGTTPTLQVNDVLPVTARVTRQGPTSLNGYMVFSPAPDVPDQTTPSPFQSNGKFVCFKSQMGLIGNNSGGGTTFTFSSLTYNGGYAAHYELTFVAEDPATGTQWSEDPEFIVEG